MDENPARFGPGHDKVARIIDQARTLTQDQAFTLRCHRDDGLSPVWHGFHGSVAHFLASPEVNAWIDAAEEAIENAVRSATATWPLKPASGWGHSIGSNAAADAVSASVYAARSAALGAMTAHLMRDLEDAYVTSRHPHLATAWQSLFPAESEAGRCGAPKEGE